MSAGLSVPPSTWNNSVRTRRILMKIDIQIFFEILSRKFKFHCILTRISGTLLENLRTFMTIYR